MYYESIIDYYFERDIIWDKYEVSLVSYFFCIFLGYLYFSYVDYRGRVVCGVGIYIFFLGEDWIKVYEGRVCFKLI